MIGVRAEESCIVGAEVSLYVVFGCGCLGMESFLTGGARLIIIAAGDAECERGIVVENGWESNKERDTADVACIDAGK